MIAEYIGTGVVKDRKGKEYEIFPYTFLTEAVSANIEITEQPIGCIAHDYDKHIDLCWVDDEFIFKDVMEFMYKLKDSELKDVRVSTRHISGKEVMLDITKGTCEYIGIVIGNSKIPIASLMLTPNGSIGNYWVNINFRGSSSLKEHIAILLVRMLEKGFIVSKGVDKLRTKVHNKDMVANRARAKFGFTEYGRLNEGGIDYFYSGQTVSDCIKHTKELIRSGR